MERFRVEVSYPTSNSGFWWKIRYSLAKLLLGKDYFHQSTVITREALEELRRQNQTYDFTDSR